MNPRSQPDVAVNWLSLGEAARRLDVHPTTLRRWADLGDVPVTRTPGGHRRFAPSDIDALALGGMPEARGDGLATAWASEAAIHTRRELATHGDAAWLAVLDDEERERNRQLGRQLMALTLQFVARGENENATLLLEEAGRLGEAYGQQCLQVGLSLSEALQASMFFRDALAEAAVHVPERARSTPDDIARILRRINTVLNNVHLAVAEAYDAR